MNFPYFCFMSSLLLLACNSSTFSGANKSKNQHIQNNNQEITIETQNETSIEKTDPIDAPEGVPTECYEKPKPLPDQLTDLEEIWYWQAFGESSNYNQVMSSPAVGTIIGNSPSIVVAAFAGGNFSGEAAVYALNGANGTQQWVAEVKSTVSMPAIGDIDNDKKREIVIQGADGYIYALYGDSGKIKWKSSISHGNAIWHSAPLLADADEDGKVEVYSYNRVLDGTTGEEKFSMAEGVQLVADINSNKGKEIMTDVGIYDAKGQKICAFSTPIGHAAAGKLRVSDTNYIVAGIRNCLTYCRTATTFAAFNAEDCKDVFSVAMPGGGGGAINMADFDGDKELEFGVAGYANYVVFDTDGTTLWTSPTSDTSSAVTGSTTFDFNGDGKMEVIYNDEYYLRIYEGASGKVIYETKNSSCTIIEYPIVADIDGDGRANIVVAANDFYPPYNTHHGVRAFRAPKNDWIGTRSLWNQYAYLVTNVGDNGEITNFDPGVIWKKWVKDEYLLGFRNNLPIPIIKKDCE